MHFHDSIGEVLSLDTSYAKSGLAVVLGALALYGWTLFVFATCCETSTPRPPPRKRHLPPDLDPKAFSNRPIPTQTSADVRKK